ncbi:MAG: AAA family ATPase [Polaromonas sp.]|nr:AAA family ATPase [Polaromonas sp.]
MLHSYAFTNFQSFLDRTEVSFVLNSKTSARGWTAESPSGARLSTALAVLGANGAGKTALLKSLAFTEWFLRRSFSAQPDSTIPVTQHFLAKDEPTEIELEAEDTDGVLWRYVLKVTPERVLHEALYKKKERFGYVFIRDWYPSSESYVIKQQGFGFAAAEAQKVRPNASLISTAAQYGVEVAQHVLNLNFLSNVTVTGRLNNSHSDLVAATALYSRFEGIRKQMISLLTRWDLGLSDVEVEEIEVTNSEGKAIKRWIGSGLHKSKHGKIYRLPIEEESSGTQSAFILLSKLLAVLDAGGVLAFDELENDLHPHMVEPVLDLFANPTTNPRNAQLIFTCHSPEVLDLLQKSQVMFVEKNSCESVGYRGDQIQGLRSDDNLRSKYLSGALGAVPRV